MQGFTRLCLVILMAIPLSQSATYAQQRANTIHSPQLSFARGIAPLLEQVAPSIVNVTAVYLQKVAQKNNQGKNTGKYINEKRSSSASGVIVDAQKGYIITNAHVIKDPNNITVTLIDGERLKAKLIGTDKTTDIAVLQINFSPLQAIKLGNSTDLKVGEPVIAIGSPFGLEQTVTMGIISALKRRNSTTSHGFDFIQTDAAINPGNSGGALINNKGKLIGINSALVSPSRASAGIGFAIPINMATRIANQLVTHRKIERGIAGLLMQKVNREIAHSLGTNVKSGTAITGIVPFSPAAEANIKVGDILSTVNDMAVSTPAQVRNLIGLERDKTVKVSLWRGNKKINTQIKLILEKNFNELISQYDPFLSGLTLMQATVYSLLAGLVNGVSLISSTTQSTGARAGLLKGDFIISANGKPVTSIKSLEKIAQQSQQTLLLRLIRKNTQFMYVVLRRN